MPAPFNIIFYIFLAIFIVTFVSVVSLMIYTITKRMRAERANDRSPRLTVRAKVVSKRTKVWFSRHSSAGATGRTQYFVTFEVDGGDRFELSLSGPESGMLAEGDMGELTLQGTRFLHFKRDNTND